MTEQLLFSKLQAAAMLGLSLGRLDLSISRGEIPVKRVGRRVLIPRSSLEHFSQIEEPREVAAGAAQ